jgi:hypothetical protein
MTLTLQQILPNLQSGLTNTGFLFGAGTSVEAGYPMMPRLTKEVVSSLSSLERGVLDDALSANGVHFEAAANAPNIELISDLVMSHAITTGSSRFIDLEKRIRSIITDIILGVTTPSLENHIRFLVALKKRAFGRPACVYIFTTNYDVLFELAGAKAGVVIETGFVGSVDRFFDYRRFSTACGIAQGQNRFAEHPVLTVRLIKLHGSISWVARSGGVIERHPAAIASTDGRVMILPRRRKVLDTLQPPHDTLFAVASRSLGTTITLIRTCYFRWFQREELGSLRFASSRQQGWPRSSPIRLLALGSATGVSLMAPLVTTGRIPGSSVAL